MIFKLEQGEELWPSRGESPDQGDQGELVIMENEAHRNQVPDGLVLRLVCVSVVLFWALRPSEVAEQ